MSLDLNEVYVASPSMRRGAVVPDQYQAGRSLSFEGGARTLFDVGPLNLFGDPASSVEQNVSQV